MGRLIDADRLKEVFSKNIVGGNAYFDLIDNAPTVGAIPKADYENRLKADMVDMLEEVKDKMLHDHFFDTSLSKDFQHGMDCARREDLMVIQEEIDSLKEG